MADDATPGKVRLSEGLGPTRDAALRELDDTTNQTWRGKRARWAALVRAQDAEIQRLRLLTFCGCGDQFTEHAPGTCGACVAGMTCAPGWNPGA